MTLEDRIRKAVQIASHNPPDPRRPFSWQSGQHFNSWFKMAMQALMHGRLIGGAIALLVSQGKMEDPRK